MKEVAKFKNPYDGYVDILYETAKRYYRVLRTRTGNWYEIFANDSEYGTKSEDYRIDCGCTLKECKELIKIYDEKH